MDGWTVWVGEAGCCLTDAASMIDRRAEAETGHSKSKDRACRGWPPATSMRCV
jgi:hypothetical protein